MRARPRLPRDSSLITPYASLGCLAVALLGLLALPNLASTYILVFLIGLLWFRAFRGGGDGA